MEKITLLIDETDKAMAYQLLAIAIKKKHKNKIRPFYELWSDDGLHTVESKVLQNQLWIDACGQSFDY